MNGILVEASPSDTTPLAPTRDETLLLYAPVPLYPNPDGGFLLEDQACNGLRLWAENFAKIIVMFPLAAELPPPNWVPIEFVGASLARIEVVALPMAYRPDQFLRAFRATRRKIRSLIQRADLMSFSIGGLFGDWGSIAGLQAFFMHRRFAVWTDRVESEVTRRTMHSGPFRRRLRARLTHRLMAWYERVLIRRAAVGMFHGRDTFEAYAPYCANPQVVHNVHVTHEDHISPAALSQKMEAARHGPLRICYVGRVEAMKGPYDWLAVLAGLAAQGVDFRAVWLGEGEDLEPMRARLNEIGLQDRVDLPGFARDRTEVMEHLRSAHAMLFCHKTPESPRCLIEALVSGTPIVGYESAFPNDLIAGNGGGILAPLDDVNALTKALCALDADRARLADLFARAARDGVPFDDESVFRHRCEILRHYLLEAPERTAGIATTVINQPPPQAS